MPKRNGYWEQGRSQGTCLNKALENACRLAQYAQDIRTTPSCTVIPDAINTVYNTLCIQRKKCCLRQLKFSFGLQDHALRVIL
jgi:hypothetical protein